MNHLPINAILLTVILTAVHETRKRILTKTTSSDSLNIVQPKESL